MGLKNRVKICMSAKTERKRELSQMETKCKSLHRNYKRIRICSLKPREMKEEKIDLGIVPDVKSQVSVCEAVTKVIMLP